MVHDKASDLLELAYDIAARRMGMTYAKRDQTLAFSDGNRSPANYPMSGKGA